MKFFLRANMRYFNICAVNVKKSNDFFLQQKNILRDINSAT